MPLSRDDLAAIQATNLRAYLHGQGNGDIQSLFDHIDALTAALAAERALADELADNLKAAQAHIMLLNPGAGWVPGLLHFIKDALSRHRAARPEATDGR
jgi:hypothetical protein